VLTKHYQTDLLTTAEQQQLAQHTDNLKRLQRQTAQNIIDTGLELIAIKELLPLGQFEDYLEHTFGLQSGYTARSAQNFMNVARMFEGKPIDTIAPSVLYLLSAPSTPEQVREHAIELVESGEKITVDRAKGMIAEARAVDVEVVEAEPTNLLKDTDWDAVPDLEVGLFAGLEGEIDLADDDSFDEQRDYISMEPSEPIRAAEVLPSVEPEFLLPERLLTPLKQVCKWFDMDLCRPADIPNVPCDRSFHVSDALHSVWGGSVFLALPESKPDRWVSKLQTSADIRISIVLCNAQTHALWFHQLVFMSSAVCFLNSSPQAVFYVGSSPKVFIDAFVGLGAIVRRAA
jgi:hypothetical protein